MTDLKLQGQTVYSDFVIIRFLEEFTSKSKKMYLHDKCICEKDIVVRCENTNRK